MIGDAKVFGGSQGGVGLTGLKAINLLVPRNSHDRILARIVYTGPVPAPVKQGQRIGRLKVFRGDNLALEVPLQAAEDVETGNLPRRAFDAVTEIFINLFRAGVARI